VGDAVFGHLDDRSQPFEVAQAEIYREVRRARLYQRPLALMTVSCTTDNPKVLPARLMELIEKELTQKYLAARMADLLAKEMRSSDIIAQRDGYFVALLPESNRDDAVELATRIESEAQESLGLRVRFGVASFPNQEVTFEKLLERAEAEMRASTGVKRQREIVAAAR
jgi:GGDEF domain-containing protein